MHLICRVWQSRLFCSGSELVQQYNVPNRFQLTCLFLGLGLELPLNPIRTVPIRFGGCLGQLRVLTSLFRVKPAYLTALAIPSGCALVDFLSEIQIALYPTFFGLLVSPQTVTQT